MKSTKEQIFFLLFLSSVLPFLHLGLKSLWVDETFSLSVAAKTLPDMFRFFYSTEANMWLYYFLLHFWVKIFGTGELAIRSMSSLFSVGSVFAIYAFVKENFDKKKAFLVSLLVTINVFFIYNAQNARSYSLFLLLSTLSSFYFLKAVKNNISKYWIFFTIFSILNFYTHIYSGLLLVTQFAYLLLFYKLDISKLTKLKKFFVAVLVMLLSYFPVLFSRSLYGGQVNWLSKPTIKDLLVVGISVTSDMPILVLLVGLMVAIYGLKLFTTKGLLKRITFEELYVVFVVIIPIILAFVISVFVKPIFEPACFIFIVPFIYILVLRSIENTFPKLLLVFCVLIISLSSIRLIPYYLNLDRWSWTVENKKEEWRLENGYISENAKLGDAVIFFSYFCRYSSVYYPLRTQTGEKLPQIEISSGSYLEGGGDTHNQPAPNIDTISQLSGKYERIWLVLCHDKSGNENDTRNMLKSEIKRSLLNDYYLYNEKDFYRVKTQLYQKR